MICPAWESVRFASERSRVRIPSGPPNGHWTNTYFFKGGFAVEVRFWCQNRKRESRLWSLGSLFIVLGILAVFLLLQPLFECRLAFLTVVVGSDFRSQMSCNTISRTNTSSTAAQRINLRCFLLCRLFLAIYFLQSSLPEAALGVTVQSTSA